MNTKRQFALARGAASIPALSPTGEGFSFEGIEPMETARDDAARLRLMLAEYADELANESPVLRRYTDVISCCDGLGGMPEIERVEAERRHLMCPSNPSDLERAVETLERFRDCQTAWEALRGLLRLNGHAGLAAELNDRRNRRAADVDRMIAEAKAIRATMPTGDELIIAELEKLQNGAGWGGDYRRWEGAARRFDTNIAADVAFIQTAVAETLVAAFADYNDRLIGAGGKPILKAAAQFALPPDVSSKGARAVLQTLNNLIGIVPPAKFAKLTVFEIVNAFERKYADLSDNLALLQNTNAAAVRAANGVAELAAEMTAWREWVCELATHPNAKPSEPKLCATVQKIVCDIWQRFKDAPADCELPGGGFRKTKRTFAECLALHGHDEVWHGKRLIDFIPDAKAFERVVHNANEKARQAKEKAKPLKPQKRITQARRKK